VYILTISSIAQNSNLAHYMKSEEKIDKLFLLYVIVLFNAVSFIFLALYKKNLISTFFIKKIYEIFNNLFLYIYI